MRYLISQTIPHNYMSIKLVMNFEVLLQSGLPRLPPSLKPARARNTLASCFYLILPIHHKTMNYVRAAYHHNKYCTLGVLALTAYLLAPLIDSNMNRFFSISSHFTELCISFMYVRLPDISYVNR